MLESLVELLGGVLWSSFAQDRARLRKLPAESQQWQLWLWVVGGTLFFTGLVAVYTWSTGQL